MTKMSIKQEFRDHLAQEALLTSGHEPITKVTNRVFCMEVGNKGQSKRCVFGVAF